MMNLRYCFLIIIAICLSSCDYFFPVKNAKNLQLDTIVNFSSVDVSPTFTICESLIDKTEQTNCFRNTIQKKIGEQLSSFSLKVNQPIDEVVSVVILINKEGKFEFQELKSSKLIEKEIPKLDSILKVSLTNLLKVYPAIKRGIPVATQYELPIRIKLEE